MQYIQGIRDFSLDRPSAVTLGKFDGVHMGHQKLIEMIQEKAINFIEENAQEISE